MPRSSSSKAQPTSSNPYPKCNKFSKSQMEQTTKTIVKTFANVFNAGDTSTDQAKSTSDAPVSEGEGSSDEEDEDLRTLRILYSASIDTLLQSSLVPLRQEIEDASKMLLNLRRYLPIFIAQMNKKGISEYTRLIIKHEGIITKAEATIETRTRIWEACETAKRDAQKDARRAKQAKKEDTSWRKGKFEAPLTEGSGTPV